MQKDEEERRHSWNERGNWESIQQKKRYKGRKYTYTLYMTAWLALFLKSTKDGCKIMLDLHQFFKNTSMVASATAGCDIPQKSFACWNKKGLWMEL